MDLSRRDLLGAIAVAVSSSGGPSEKPPSMSPLAKFREKFRIPELQIHANEHWIWSVRPSQPTLGAGILSLKRYCPNFGLITNDEGAALGEIVRTCEHRLKARFAPDRINYLMLMMVDHHVHFHMIPRYGRPVTHLGTTWEDRGWPSLPELSDDQNTAGTSGLHAINVALAGEDAF